MSENSASRRDFLRMLGLSAGASITGRDVFAAFTSHEEIRSLTPTQQKFMVEYGKWMDEFAEASRIQKAEPGNMENRKKMMVLAEEAQKFKPDLDVFMQDKTFSTIYKASIQRVVNEI